MTMVRLANISKAYRPETPVLTDVSIQIESGELFFLLGPSGCGKSTLLRILAGLIMPDRGRIYFDAADVTEVATTRRSAAMVFQSYALWPHMSVAENVGFGLDVRRADAAAKQQRVTEALELVDLAELATRKIPSLSGGQQQRVALARAIVVRPQVLLLDEPLSNLDAKLRATMRSEIRRICKAAALTAIYVTHDQKEALSMADRLAVLDQGRLQQVGSPRQLYCQPATRFVADFIGESNFFAAKVLARNPESIVVETALGVLHSQSSGSWQVHDHVTVLIRPESFVADTTQSSNQVHARISNSVFLGDSGAWQCCSNDVSFTAAELRPTPRQSGDQVSFHIHPQDVILLPGE